MENLMELVIRFKKTRSEIILAEIFEIIKSMMWKYIHRINQFYKEDFMQELFIKTYEIIVKFEIQINPFDSASIIRNQKQLIYLLKSKYKYLVADFYRNNREYFEKEIKCSNIDHYSKSLISKEKLSLEEVLKCHDFLDSEIEFLSLFIEDERLLTQKEVARKLGISQQTISRKFNEIVKKYRKNE